MLKRHVSLLIMLLAAPLAAQAADFDYSYLEGGYASVSRSGGGSSLTGFDVDGSYQFMPNWHAIAGYQHVSCCGGSQNTLDAGAGWNTGLTEKVDLYIDGEFLSVDTTGPGTHTGWAAEGGIRAALAEQFELDGFVNHSDVDSNTENTLGVRGLFALDKNWHLFASYSNNSDFDTFLLGVRYNF